METRDLMVPHGVIWGASYDSIVVIDKDDLHPVLKLREGIVEQSGFEYVCDLALGISHRWNLGDSLIVLSSVDWDRSEQGHDTCCSFYFLYDRIVAWGKIHQIITTLAREGFLEDKLRSLQMLRGDFTHRMTRKDRGGFVPFPFAYVPCTCKRSRWFVGGGLETWLKDWKIACRISG